MNCHEASILTGLNEAIDFSRGRRDDSRVFTPEPVDVKEIRKMVKLSQAGFASKLGISVATLRHWERGDRAPNGPALVLLNLLKKDHKTIFEILNR